MRRQSPLSRICITSLAHCGASSRTPKVNGRPWGATGESSGSMGGTSPYTRTVRASLLRSGPSQAFVGSRPATKR
jgi:hypothetical protein